MSDIEKKSDIVIVQKISVEVGSTNEINVPNFSHIRSVVSQTGAGEVNYINAATATSDNQLLAEIGYKQELKRQFTPLQVFGIAFSIMGLLPSIASVMGGGLAGGPVTLVWGWFVAGGFILAVGINMAENASAIPTAGGLYYWTHYYSPKGYKEVISFVIGYSNTLALVAAVCSIDYGFAEEVLAAVVLSKDGNFEVNNGMIYGVFAASVVAMGFCACLASKTVGRLQTLSIFSNCFIIILFLIALPIGTKKNIGHFNDGNFIFGKFENFSDWNNGWQFCVAGLMPAVWTISAFDSCVYTSEEAQNARRSVPVGIISSISLCWILGFLILICSMACMSTNIDGIINNQYGFAMAQIIYDSLGKEWAIAFMALMAFCQFLMGASIVTSTSRQIYAFSRDEGLPFSHYLKKVGKTYPVPFNAVIFACIISLILGLLCLIDDAAASALFSLNVAGNNLAWCAPTFMRITWGRDLFRPGPFYLGKIWSPIVSWIAVLYQVFLIILVMFPTTQHGITKTTMNYTCVIAGSVWLFSWVYYLTYKKKFYRGPQTNLTDEQFEDAVGQDIIDEILTKQV
ncbi:GABA-specific permease [Monosporozyma unispora]|nr:GABA-specific high-affinity permease [Kazachstania unispora]